MGTGSYWATAGVAGIYTTAYYHYESTSQFGPATMEQLVLEWCTWPGTATDTSLFREPSACAADECVTSAIGQAYTVESVVNARIASRSTLFSADGIHRRAACRPGKLDPSRIKAPGT
jgi:hypothetical protein